MPHLSEIQAAAGLASCRLRPVTDAFANEVYHADGQSILLKIMRDYERWNREQYVAQLLREHQLPAPAVYAAGQVGDRYYLVVERIPGCSLQEVLEYAPNRTMQEAGTILARIHSLSLPHFGKLGRHGVIATPGTWSALYTKRFTHALRHPYIQHSLTEQQLQACERYWEERRPALMACSPTLLHMDYRPGNILVDPATGAITGVIDFEHAIAGAAGLEVTKVKAEFFRKNPDGCAAFMGAYAALRPLPSAAESEAYMMLNCLNRLILAVERGLDDLRGRCLDEMKNILKARTVL